MATAFANNQGIITGCLCAGRERTDNPIYPLSILRNKTVVNNMFTALVMFFVAAGVAAAGFVATLARARRER